MADEQLAQAMPDGRDGAVALVELCGVSRSYRTGEVNVPALRGVDLSITVGELVVLLGPSQAWCPPDESYRVRMGRPGTWQPPAGEHCPLPGPGALPEDRAPAGDRES